MSDNPEFSGFNFNGHFGQEHQGPAEEIQDGAHLAQSADAEVTPEAPATHHDFIELNVSPTAAAPVTPELAPSVAEIPEAAHICNDPAHQMIATPPSTPKATIPMTVKALVATAALSNIKAKVAPATDIHAKRRRNFKIVAILVIAVVGFNLLNNWAHSSTRVQATTAATGLNQSEQISNIEMITADASLRREYSAVRLQLLRYGNLNNYQPTTGFAVLTYQGRVAIVTSIGSHCWDLLADGNRTRLSHDSAACGPNAATLLDSELRAGI